MNELWSSAKKILCVRLDTMGDVLMTAPALRAIKQSVPDCRITMLTSAQGEEAARLVPEIDETLVYAAPWMKATAAHIDSGPSLQMIERLRADHFDGAVIFTVYSQNPLPAALLCFLADIPLRLAHCRENPYHLLTDWAPDTDAALAARHDEMHVRHEVQRQLDLVATVGFETEDQHLSIRVSDGARQHVIGLLDDIRLDRTRPWAVLHAGASAPSRRYPPESFAAAARQLVDEWDWQIIFTGSPREGELVECIRKEMAAPSHSLVGQLNLEDLAALLALAPLLISNNTGPVHVAAAVGTPVVDLYALTNPQHTPWGVPHRLLQHDVSCRYCYKSICPQGHQDCLRLVEPQEVVHAAVELMREGQTNKPGVHACQRATLLSLTGRNN